MEHIVQFAIGIDDDAIRKRIENDAYDDILMSLIDEAKRDLPKQRGFNSKDVNWRFLMEEELEKFCEQHKDEIIDAAADKLFEHFKRTKAFREKMSEAMDQ